MSNSVWKIAPMALALLVSAAQVDELWSQPWDGQRQKGPSYRWDSQNKNSEVADDLELVATIEQIRVGGAMSFQHPAFQGLYVRFYACGADNKPGAL